MEKFDFLNECSLLVCSSDKYKSAWYPYFELIKIYWKDCPKQIFLNSETEKFVCEGLEVKTINCYDDISWSERLYRCLEKIPTKYVFFSLEDFFLLSEVNNELICRAYNYMEKDDNIAVCRLNVSNDEKLIKNNKYEDFRIAKEDIPYRLDTQFALWNRKTLMSFLDFSEDPWQFETCGTKRVKNTDKVFLYYYQEDYLNLKKMIYPYYINQKLGYGIAWGRWLWNNKNHFEKNSIYNVDYKKLGVLSEKSVKNRFKYLYKTECKGIYVIVRALYRLIDRMQRGFQFLRIFGLVNGIKRIYVFINR